MSYKTEPKVPDIYQKFLDSQELQDAEIASKLDIDDYHVGYTWGEAKQAFTWGTIKGDRTPGEATQTTNLHLVKPGYNSLLDIDDINDNMDILDTAIASKASTSYVDEAIDDALEVIANGSY